MPVTAIFSINEGQAMTIKDPENAANNLYIFVQDENRGDLHDKETFIDYLQDLGYNSKEIRAIFKRIQEQKMSRHDFNLFMQYIMTCSTLQKHFYDC